MVLYYLYFYSYGLSIALRTFFFLSPVAVTYVLLTYLSPLELLITNPVKPYFAVRFPRGGEEHPRRIRLETAPKHSCVLSRGIPAVISGGRQGASSFLFIQMGKLSHGASEVTPGWVWVSCPVVPGPCKGLLPSGHLCERPPHRISRHHEEEVGALRFCLSSKWGI